MQLNAWLQLIEQNSGMILPEFMYHHVAGKVLEQTQARGLTPSGYYRVVSNDSFACQSLLESVLIHESRFFRDPASMDFVYNLTAHLTREVLIWCAGCSSGEEVWSLAMMLTQSPDMQFQIFGTDISSQIIAKAKRSKYSIYKLPQIPEQYQQLFTKADSANYFDIIQPASWQIDLFVFNLLEQHYPYRQLDVIYCQNVLIYFRVSERFEILNKMVHCLRLGGVIVLGSGEIQWSHSQMRRVDSKEVLAYARIK